LWQGGPAAAAQSIRGWIFPVMGAFVSLCEHSRGCRRVRVFMRVDGMCVRACMRGLHACTVDANALEKGFLGMVLRGTYDRLLTLHQPGTKMPEVTASRLVNHSRHVLPGSSSAWTP
jgi:hypothetical protein